jgi:hypothetical protein
MADSGIKNVTIFNDDLPIINATINGYAVRYRIVSEDKNRVSHWSPIHYIDAGYTYIAGQVPEVVQSGNAISVIWDKVQVQKAGNLIGKIRDYELWVRWGRDGEGDWIYEGKSNVNSLSLMVPPTYLVDGEDQEQRPNEFSLEIYLESVPVSRSNQQLLMYSLAEIAV